jgi:hypothetical protein
VIPLGAPVGALVPVELAATAVVAPDVKGRR